MPFAGLNNGTERFDLKSLPGAYVELRRMSYGQKLARQDLIRLSVEMGKGKDMKGEMAMANKLATKMDFANCIAAHNLEKDDNGTLFNFNTDSLDMLDPRVGEEIDKYINQMNNFEDTDEGNE